MFLLNKNFLINFVKTYVVGVDLVKAYKALIRLASGVLSGPPLTSMSEAFSVLFHFNKTLLSKSSWVIKPVLLSQRSSSQIKNPILKKKKSNIVHHKLSQEITNLQDKGCGYRERWWVGVINLPICPPTTIISVLPPGKVCSSLLQEAIKRYPSWH